MRVTVRAGEVREGDRLIVPDENGGEREVAVEAPCPIRYDTHGALLLAVRVVRHSDEPVVVERPDPPITITVQLTPEEAHAWSHVWTIAVGDAPYTTASVKVRAAIVAARAGETQ